MTDERRKKMIATLEKMRALMEFVPDLADGPIDDVVMEGVKALLTAIIEALRKGRSVQELRDTLRVMSEKPLDRLDLETVLERALRDLGLP